MLLDQLKKNRVSAADLAEKAKQAESTRDVDDRFWTPTTDKAGNGYAVIRFLPCADEDARKPWARYWEHIFKGPTNKWYRELCRTSIGENDPVNDMNMAMWDDNDKEVQKVISQRKRKLKYVANIMVISDPEHPENEGTVRLFRFGPKIMTKITSTMEPPAAFKDAVPRNPFDLWDGVDFTLKIATVDEYPNYDQSTFNTQPSPVLDGSDEALSDVAERLHSLKEWTEPEHFKSYEELQKRLNDVLGTATPRPAAAMQDASLSQTLGGDSIPTFEDKQTEKPAANPVMAEEKPMETAPAPAQTTADADENDILAKFKAVVNSAS